MILQPIEQLKQAVKNVVDLIKQPFYALRDAISKVIKTVKMVVKRIKQTLVAIKRLVLSILRVITSVFQWLGSIVNICNKKLGTPFDRCQRVFEGAVADCKAKLGPVFGGICNLTYIVSALCYIVKPLDFICMLVSYVADTIVDAVRKKIKRFTRHMRAMFYVKVKFSHSFHFETNHSRTLEEVSTGIITEVRSRTDRFLAVFDWMSFMTTFFIFFMLLRVLHYRHKWLTNERFDNRYLTDDLRTIDLIRTRQDKETILPLNRRERNQYIPLTSITLIKVERVKLTKSAVFLCLTTFKICIHMMADYSLYWILSTIRYHGRIETKVQRPSSVGVYVSGNGYLADLYRSIVKAFTPHAKDPEIDMMPCLPDPIPPDLDRYTQIVTLIAFCWIMAIFEPYGLRLRHVVMCKYHPERAKQRAAWLYNHIIRSRGSFLKFARRQLRRKFGITEGEKIERVTFRERCLAMCPFLNKLFPQKQNMCLLCGAVERSDQEPHVKCTTPGCVGLFCIQCFADLQNLCTICRSPIEYGDLTDMSEEKDSSDDQLIVKKEPVPIIKEEIPHVEKEPEVKIKIEEIPEKRLSEEEIPKEEMPDKRLLKERLSEEKIPTEELSKEELVEKELPKKIIFEEIKREDEKIEREIEKKDKAVQTDDDETSSDSIYSYTYQDESPQEIEVVHRRIPFKDVEAQKIKEDVTIQIFNDALAEEITSTSEDPTSCFVVRARRRLRTRLKRKSCSCPRKEEDSSSSTSIADTESWPTEELDEEEVVHIEMDDGSKELLLKDGAVKEKKRSRVKRILAALAKIPWLGKSTRNDRDSDGEWKARKPSLLDKIAQMLPGNQSVSPVRTYRRIRTTKKNAKCKESCALSSSTDEEDEQSMLLEAHNRQVDCLQIHPDHDDHSEDNIYSRDYDSHRVRRRTICRQRGARARSGEPANLKHPHEKKFATTQLPRYLQSISRDTAYFEVDEIKDERSTRMCVRSGERINDLADTRVCVEHQKLKRHVTSNVCTRISCSCTSHICNVQGESKVCQSDMSAVTEQSDEAPKTEGIETDRELLSINWELNQRKSMEQIITKKTSMEIETNQREVLEKIASRDGQRKLLAETGGAVAELNNIAQEEILRKYFVRGEQSKKLDVRGKAETSTSRVNDKPQLYYPLAGSELHSGTYRAKRCEKSAEEKLTKQPEATETRIDDREAVKSTEFEEGVGTIQGDSQIIAHGRKPTEMSTGNIRKFKRYDKSDKILHSDQNAEMFKASDLEEKGGKRRERKRKRWVKRSEPGCSSPRGRRKLRDKATLIKEKQYCRRKQKETRDCDVQTPVHSSMRREEDSSRTSRADDIRRRGTVTSALKPVAGLSENRQTQCNLRDRDNLRKKQDNACSLALTSESEAWSCSVQPQYKAPEQVMVQEHRRKSLNERSDRQATSRVSPQHKNVFTTRDDSYMSTEMHEDTIPVKSKINNERKSKRYSKPTNNVNTNNRRMTGNVNIYICSETNSPSLIINHSYTKKITPQERSKRRLKLQSCTETSSDITTERSNSRCISASSASSCKLLNSIQEKRRKLQAKQLTNSVHQEKDGSSDNSDNAVRDDKILHGSYRKELSESSKEQINIKVTDEDTECQDAISRDSTRDGCCCKDPSFSSTDLPQDSLDSVIPRLHFNECDESACSWTTIYPLETRAKMDDSDGSSLNAICMGRGTRYGNDERSNVCRNVRSTTCDAIDGSSWLPRSIYTDCAKVDGDVPKECFTNSGKYRNERLQKPMLNRNDIWWKQAGCKLPQEPLRDSRKEPTTRRWPTCSCIVEEEEDRCANVGRGDKESSEDPCDNVECPKKISVCQIPSSALVETVTVCETPFRNAEKHCEETPACESPLGDSAECPRAAIPCGTTFENSEEPPKVTRVCKEFVAGEPPKDIAVCGTTVGEPKGPPEEVTVCKSSLLDSGEAPKETISKTIPDSNFASQEDVDSVSLNDAKDKLVRENTDMANLNNQKENAGNVGSMVQSNDKSNIVSNNLTKLTFAKNVTQNERTKGNVLNNRSRNPIVPVGSVEYSKQRVSRNVYSTALARMEFPNRPNFTSNHNPQEILKIPIDKRGAAKMRSPLNRPTKIHLEQQNKVLKDLTTRDLTSSKNNQVDEKIQENSKEKEEVQDIPKEKEMAEEKPRESILHTSLKKLIDVIKHYRVQLKDKIETKNIEVKETVIDDKEDVTQLESISETREKIDDEKERRDVNKETHIKEIGDTVHVARPKPTAPIADFTVPEESKKADQVTSSENQTHLMPKLLRIIAAKRSHLLPIVTATTEPKRQEPKVESVPVEIPINEYVTREETVQEKVIPHVEPFPQEEVILQEESILQKEVSEEPIVQFTEERKKEVSLVPEIGEVEATAKEIIDISESVVGKDIVSEDFTRAVIKVDVPCSKKIERKDESQGVVSCKYESLSDPFDYTCSTAKCTEVRIACPQKKLEEEQDESIACKCKLHPVSKDCSRFIAKCKYNNAFDDCVCKINELEQKKDCTHCHLSIEQCICASTQYLKSCLKINKPKFRDISSLKDSPHICTNYCKEKKEYADHQLGVSIMPNQEISLGTLHLA
ncbi:uncharacterized protein LOC105277385 [Ooceraea biroi]|uniref:uncharacterized protein LOC105277385 n=1 Tax=Ooceraea biroi TaxID=2015173 RepID=UPI000F08710E|nr:uncharacterized protein LOC105277385 [Ooceraea biroi]